MYLDNDMSTSLYSRMVSWLEYPSAVFIRDFKSLRKVIIGWLDTWLIAAKQYQVPSQSGQVRPLHCEK